MKIKKMNLKPKRKYVIDEDIRRILMPFYIFQMLFCIRKFIIIKKHISTVSLKDILMSLLANAANISLMVLVSTNIISSWQPRIAKTFAVFMYMQLVVNFLVTTILNVGFSKINIHLVLKLQHINRLLRNPEEKLSKIIITIWISIIIGFLIYTALFVMKSYLDPLWNVPRIVMYVISMTMDIEMIYVNVVAYFIASKIKRWNELVCNNKPFNQNGGFEDADENIVKFRVFNELINGNNMMSQLFSFRVSVHSAD